MMRCVTCCQHDSDCSRSDACLVHAGNMIFLPRGACVIDIVPQNNLDKHGWAFFMAADFRPLGFNPIAVPPQKTVLMLHKVKQSPEWRYLSSHWRCACHRLEIWHEVVGCCSVIVQGVH